MGPARLPWWVPTWADITTRASVDGGVGRRGVQNGVCADQSVHRIALRQLFDGAQKVGTLGDTSARRKPARSNRSIWLTATAASRAGMIATTCSEPMLAVVSQRRKSGLSAGQTLRNASLASLDSLTTRVGAKMRLRGLR